MSTPDIDSTRKAAQPLKEMFGMSDAELEEHISFAFNRRLLAKAEEMGRAKIVAEVTESKNCLAGCQVGQKLVFKCTPAILLPEESTCPLCSKAIGPVAELVMQMWDRMTEDLDPNDGQAQFASCLDQGIKYGGLGNVRLKVYVEKG
jgi:uncharacterized repeat protein (TIGR04076 family)